MKNGQEHIGSTGGGSINIFSNEIENINNFKIKLEPDPIYGNVYTTWTRLDSADEPYYNGGKASSTIGLINSGYFIEK